MTNPNRRTDADKTRRRRRALIAAAMALVASAVLASCIVFTGRTGDSIRFPEEKHRDLFAHCSTCHEGVAGDRVDAGTRRALESSCMKCHANRKDECAFCHADVDSAGKFPDRDRHLNFSHKEHLERTHGSCQRCHPGAHGAGGDATVGTDAGAGAEVVAADAPVVADVAMPAHPQCFSCHQMNDFYEKLECANCHQDLARFGLKPYESFSHSGDFVRRGHGVLLQAGGSAATCAQCHAPKFCDECHFTSVGLTPPERNPERVDRKFIHRGDYVFRHPWDARSDAASCIGCHSQAQCRDCHDQRGVSEKGALARNDGFKFHGAGVLFPGSPDFHGTAARRDIVSCAACHADGASGNCVTCHTVGAFGGNPHPPGFRSRLDRHGAPVCRLCHH
jgi:hypothetical protein